MYGFCSSNALYSASLPFRMFNIWIKSQPGVAYKSVVYKRAFSIVFKSSKNEKITFLHSCIFVFIWYFIGAILSEKSCQKWGVWKEYKKGGWP